MAPPVIANKVGEWWATDLALSHGAAVTTWPDRIGSAHVTQSTPAARPTFNAAWAQGNNRPCVEFDGADYLVSTVVPSTATSGHVIAVCQRDGDLTTSRAIWAGGRSTDTNHWLTGFAEANRCSVGHRVTSSANTDGVAGMTVDVNNNPRILSIASTGTAYEMWSESTPQALSVLYGTNSGDWFGDTILNRWAIGALVRNAVNLHWLGRIAYLAVFNGPLSTPDRTTLIDWILDYYFPPRSGFHHIGLVRGARG